MGLGSQSTLFYIKELNTRYNQLHGGYSTCPFKLLNTNFHEINSLLPIASTRLDELISSYVAQLIALGVDRILIPNITLHQTIDRLQLDGSVLHPIQLAVEALQEEGHQKTTLIGSKYSMQSNYIHAAFEASGIEVSLPTYEEMERIDEVRKAVYQGSTNASMLSDFQHIIGKYDAQNSVTIGCTELSIAMEIGHKQVFDMVRLQIEASL